METIATIPQPHCYLCNHPGTFLYQGLTDSLFHTPGEWNLRRCVNPECGLVWLDPLPTEADLGKIYTNYYTHQEHQSQSPSSPRAIFLYELFLSLLGLKKEREEVNWLYLESTTPGKLLDVGCGNGSRLAQFQSKGWQVEGQEVDPAAAAYANKTYQIPVHLGSLTSLNLPDNSYDAIIMSHVIEHIHDPIALLRECRRLLKPGGILMGITPNIASYSHRFFRTHWRGLEPPRHLHLFSVNTLAQVALAANFEQVNTWTTAAHSHFFALSSIALQQGDPAAVNSRNRLQALGFQLWTKLLNLRQLNYGDECILKAIK